MKEIINYDSFSDKDTFDLGEKLGRTARAGDIFCIDGDLGTGKTVFTQGFAMGLDIQDHISSPTFTIIQIYEDGRLPLYHFDVYRIGDISEMDEIGYEDYFFGQGVCLIEWSGLIKELLPENLKYIEISKDSEKGFNYRLITMQGVCVNENISD